MGKGVGDLYVKAILRSFVSETYTIEDCRKYIETTSITGLNTINYFQQWLDEYTGTDVFVSAKIKETSASQGSVANSLILCSSQQTNIALDNYNNLRNGVFGSAYGLLERNNNSSVNNRTNGTLTRLNTEYLHELYLENGSVRGVITRTSDNNKLYDRTVTPINSLTSIKYIGLSVGGNATVIFSDVKIKLL